MRAIIALAILSAPLAAQPPFAKPGPEHEILELHEGTWDTTLNAGGQSFKGTTTAKMEVGGMWLVGSMESDFIAGKYYGKSLDSYDPQKKKYTSVWADSMSGSPMFMEGDYDAATKTLTMTGDGPTMDGKIAKWKSVTTNPDKDTFEMKMYVGDAKEPMFTVTYKRKK